MHHLTMESPLGPLTISATENAIVGLVIGQRHGDSAPTNLLTQAKTQLDEYFAGHRRDFDLPLHFQGTPFQEAIWTTLPAIGHGETVSYRELGEQAGVGRAPRAAGGAVGKNPIPVIIPCHRVLATTGRITGYSGGEGIATKEKLLDLEGISYR
jgi:methylated-DNA-[protein]-cysteine S-methyltransferase